MAAKQTLSKDAADIESYFERKAVRMAEAWMPAPGATFRGQVIGLRMGGQNSPYGLYPIVVYKDLADNSVKAVHAFHQTLRDKLAELKTDIGSIQWISYEGVRETNESKKRNDDENRTRYHLYDVENDGADAVAKEENFTF